MKVYTTSSELLQLNIQNASTAVSEFMQTGIAGKR